MPYIIMGSIAFLFFFLYDYNSVKMKQRWIHKSFFIGCVLLTAATGNIILSAVSKALAPTAQMVVFGLFSLFFLLLLIYTLFFALPFEDTYRKTNTPPKTCKSGVYALSRHPGVLWFIGFYFFLWLSLWDKLVLIAAVTFSLLNLIYVLIQDRWTFMKTFTDYHEYKKTTPFLIPSLQSIRRCLHTLQLVRR